jgi:hypothetical protein
MKQLFCRPNGECQRPNTDMGDYVASVSNIHTEDYLEFNGSTPLIDGLSVRLIFRRIHGERVQIFVA